MQSGRNNMERSASNNSTHRAFEKFVLSTKQRCPNIIYRDKKFKSTKLKHSQLLFVTFSFHWPSRSRYSDFAQLTALPGKEADAASAVFRVLDFLERSTLANYTVYEIRSGCTVAILQAAERQSFRELKFACNALMEKMDTFQITSCSAFNFGVKEA